MSKPEEIFSWDEYFTCPSGTAKTWVGPKVPAKRVVRLETFIICNETKTNRALMLGYEKAGVKCWIRAGNAGSGGNDISIVTPLILSGGEAPAAYSSTHATSDIIHILARGLYLK
jgi:hypothetical protein